MQIPGFPDFLGGIFRFQVESRFSRSPDYLVILTYIGPKLALKFYYFYLKVCHFWGVTRRRYNKNMKGKRVFVFSNTPFEWPLRIIHGTI